MILILTNRSDATADYLCEQYLSGVPFIRINTDDLRTISIHFDGGVFSLRHGNVTVSPDDIVGVWYRRPGRLVPPVEHPEFAVNQFIIEEWTEAIESFLEAIPFARWMNHPCSNVRASRKLHQLQAATRASLRIPVTHLTSSNTEARRLMERHGHLVTKPLGSGVLQRESGFTQIYTSEVSAIALELDRRTGCPTLYQERIRKSADVRVTVVDAEMFAVGISSLDTRGEQVLDIRQGMSAATARYFEIDIPMDVMRGIREIMTLYHLRFGAFDFAIDHDGNWVFFEVNPNGQWAWLDLEAGLSIGRTIALSLVSHSAQQGEQNARVIY